MAFTSHLSFFSLLTLFLSSVHATLNLNLTDHHALLTIFKNLSPSGEHPFLDKPCSTVGISCDKGMSENSKTLRITHIVFKNHRLGGFISPVIGELSELKELSLPNNQISDQIPNQIIDCRELEILDLHGNRISGKVPVELSSLVRLRILDLSSNKFSGDLGFLKHFPNLEKLSLDDNMFTGKVPASLSSFRNLRIFNVSGNSFLEDLVMNKQLVPHRYILEESKLNLTNHNVSKPNNSQALAPSPSPMGAPDGKHHKKSKIRKKILGWLVGIFAGSIAGVLSIIIFSVAYNLVVMVINSRKNQSGIVIFSQSIKKEELAFLEKDESVTTLPVIGKGGCGEVYKTDLQNEKIKTIAIKKVIQPANGSGELSEEDTKLLDKKMRQIRSEIQTVGRIRHRNLLPLLAHVSRPNCHYLVYEFMQNGSLQDVLQQANEGTRDFDWLTRYKIAVGVASGLEYLHISHAPRIVHRDLKPANVLLDDDMEARITDFGLAKSIPDAETHMTSSNVAGTLGYIAPEYHQTMKYTDKCDVFGFGVLLGVLVIGKLPSDEFFQHTLEINFVRWMRNVMTSDDPKQAIDTKLMGNGYEEQMLLVLKLACYCTLDNPKERPNSKQCKFMLGQIQH